MRSVLAAIALLLGGVTAAVAQESYSGDAAVTYHWVHTNAGPGQCGCFGLNGGGVSGSWKIRGRWSLVTEISSEYTPSAPTTANSLTLTSYLVGARYQLPQPWLRGAHSPRPFAQVLLGAGHSGGGEAGIGDSSYAFATRMGGGVDLPVSSRFAVRIIQIDYYLTQFANADNGRQNNLLVGAGIVFHWTRAK